MHYFLIENRQGYAADRNNMLKSLTEAGHLFGGKANVVCAIAKGHKVYWMSASHSDRAIAELESEGVEILFRKTGSEIATDHAKPAPKAPANAARVSHPKFGEGSVLFDHPNNPHIEVLFDGAKKKVRMARASVTAI